jgi:hypothetical protein
MRHRVMVGAQHQHVIDAIYASAGERDDVMGMEAFPASRDPAADLTPGFSSRFLEKPGTGVIATFRLGLYPLTARPIPVSEGWRGGES